LTDLLTKSMSKRTFEQLIHKIEFCHLNDINLKNERNRICHD